MKLIIQIPCYNEEASIGLTFSQLPRKVEGFSSVQWLIINDGSTDRTVEEAIKHGADHVVDIPVNRGLANAFIKGLEKSLELRADVIVNTDADNQYDAKDIPILTKPILDNRADMVVGARPIADNPNFSTSKILLSKLGSWVVRIASGTDILDSPSGFRAFNRTAALRMNVFSKYTYTLETIIQAGQSGLRIQSVPINVNEDIRPSRLLRSIPSYLYKSMGTILRMFVIYRPFRFFITIGAGLFFAALVLGGRFLYFFILGDSLGHVQSLILATILSVIGSIAIMTAFVADLLAVNRRLLEELVERARQEKLDGVG